MQIRAELNYLHIAPRKVRLVADAIRGKPVREAEITLRFLTRGAARPIAKLLAAAVASARHDFQITDPGELAVSDIQVGGGPMLKRTMPRAFGRAALIRKRTSHVRLVLSTGGAALPRRTKRPAEVAVLKGEELGIGPIETGGEPLRRERPAGRVPSRLFKTQTDFVRRVFRRKAI